MMETFHFISYKTDKVFQTSVSIVLEIFEFFMKRAVISLVVDDISIVYLTSDKCFMYSQKR